MCSYWKMLIPRVILTFIHKNALDSLDNLIGQNVITWGLTGLSKSQQRVCDSCSLAVLCDADFNQSDGDRHHVSYSCSLEVFRVSPKCKFAHFYLALFKFFFFFLHFENEIDTGIYAFGSVLNARDHTQHRSLTCGKDRTTNCYSLYRASKWLRSPLGAFYISHSHCVRGKH